MNFRKIFRLPALALMAIMVLASCEEDNSHDATLTNYVGLQAFANLELAVGAVGTVDAKIYASDATSEDRTFTLVVDEESTTADPAFYTVPATVTIPAGSREGLIQIGVTGIDLSNGKEIHIGLAPQAGVNYAYNPTFVAGGTNEVETVTGPTLVVNLSEECLLNKLTIEIVTDAYGTETSWELYDSDLVLIGSGGPFQDLDASGTFAQTPFNICLPDGNYTFVAYDAFGDGMDSGGGAGYYRLVKRVDGVPVEIAKNGVFATDDIVEFSLP